MCYGHKKIIHTAGSSEYMKQKKKKHPMVKAFIPYIYDYYNKKDKSKE